MTDLYTEIFINAPTGIEWKAFVEPNQFFMAFYGADIHSNFNIGDSIEYSSTYEGSKTVHIYGEILEYEEEKLLAYSDHPGPMYNENHAELSSRVRATFEAFGESTRMTITNDQFSDINPMMEEAKQWYLILSNFKTWIETGQLMNLPKQ